MLFDLSVDQEERTDLAAQRPDLGASFKRLLTDWEADVDQGHPADRRRSSRCALISSLKGGCG